MNASLAFTPTAVGTEFRLLHQEISQPVDSWAVAAPNSLLPAVDLLNRLVAEERALADGDLVLVEHAAVADLSAAEAAGLNLPPLSDAIVRVETSGIVTNPAFTATIQWRRSTGQPLVGAERIGAWLKVGDGFGRLSSALFAIAEAVDGVAMAGGDPSGRLLAVGRLQELLPSATREAEHDRHLEGVGLGNWLVAYGAGLRSLLTVNAEGIPAIDQAKLRQADWVLTTYETLRDYDRDFGAVRFAALLADEAQKVKTPGARVTDAIKGMNVDFRIAMTGTPVENRLADLWCIVDGVHSGWLGDLKGFSRLYEAYADVERLAKLKSLLDRPVGGAPALLLRRMKADELPDLPRAAPHIEEVTMPSRQSAAYDRIIAEVRGANRKGAVLEALQKLRLVALHPEPQMAGSDVEFIAASARLKVCFDALDRIAKSGERALVFLDSIDMQSRLAGLIQRRYGLAAPPAIINGEVAGHRRQQRVDRFQAAPDGFDAMILSPRAGGVGLTLTRANHVIHLARWWNPAVEDQCTGRALRIGQSRTVHVHIPIGVLADGRRSFDQNLHELLERKRRLMRDALLPGGFNDDDQRQLLESTTSPNASTAL
jgi:SNF2-related domain/Helicase conserved C-terminal domain